MFTKIFQWFVYSSANPQSISLTVKAGLSFLIFLGVDKALLDGAEETIVGSIVTFGVLFTQLITLFGFLRKVLLTFKK